MVNFWAGKRVLVTGATGLVGSWLVKALLAADAQVIAFVRDADPQSEFYRSGDYRRTNIVYGELEDYEALERGINEHAADTVFHLAAQPIVGAAFRSPLQTFESNIRGTYHLLEACRRLGGLVKRIVIASSDKAYGDQPELPYTESMPLQGRQPYEVSKSCADLITQSYAITYGLPVTIARCGNIYGGGDLNWSRIVPDTIRACLRGVPVIIRSDGLFVRDYIYVRDVCSAYMRLAEHTGSPTISGAFNFGPTQPLTVLELVAVIQRLMGCPHLTPVILNQVQGEIHSQYLDSSRASALLGWQPQFSLEDGLNETIAWYRAFLEQADTRS
jgi:CDP-glucose 4,6-dehydratase